VWALSCGVCPHSRSYGLRGRLTAFDVVVGLIVTCLDRGVAVHMVRLHAPAAVAQHRWRGQERACGPRFPPTPVLFGVDLAWRHRQGCPRKMTRDATDVV